MIAPSNIRADHLADLVCPVSKLSLLRVRVSEAEERLGRRLKARPSIPNAKGVLSHPIGVTEWVLLRADLQCAYPIVDGYPILLAPEALFPQGSSKIANLSDPMYAEAYEEMEVYNEAATEEAKEVSSSEAFEIIAPILRQVSRPNLESFPEPRGVWLDAIYDCAGQSDAYTHLAPVRGHRVLQLGGKGIHAVKMLLGGASRAWLLTPMLGEARFATALAITAGVGDRLECIVAVAEQIPLADGTVDRIYSGGCLHHMTTSVALVEAERILTPGGRFAAVDPWKAPLYAFGIRLFGKREKNVYCVPLDAARIAPATNIFRSVRIIHHGAITRYPLLALQKLGLSVSLAVAWAITKVDDAISSFIPRLRRQGSSVVVLATK
jgi:uncharacterized protein YbaR (Trm112 family)